MVNILTITRLQEICWYSKYLRYLLYSDIISIFRRDSSKMNIPHRILTPDEDKTFSKTLESDSSTEFVTAQNSLADVSTAYVQYFTSVCIINPIWVLDSTFSSWDSSKFSNF